jgi:hypothetical protein
MRPPGSAKLWRRRVWSTRVEQESVNVGTVDRDHLQRRTAFDVNYLHPAQTRFELSQPRRFSGIDRGQDLDSGWVSAPYVSRYRVRRLFIGHQKCRYTRGRHLRDVGDG